MPHELGVLLAQILLLLVLLVFGVYIKHWNKICLAHVSSLLVSAVIQKYEVRTAHLARRGDDQQLQRQGDDAGLPLRGVPVEAVQDGGYRTRFPKADLLRRAQIQRIPVGVHARAAVVVPGAGESGRLHSIPHFQLHHLLQARRIALC